MRISLLAVIVSAILAVASILGMLTWYSQSSSVVADGVVVDDRGRPIAAASVELLCDWCTPPKLTWRHLDASGATDANGHFRVRSGGGAEALRISARGFAHQALVIHSSDDALRIVLHPAVPLAGRVVDERGRPVEGAAVQVETSLVARANPREVRTDHDGMFQIDGVAAIPCHVSVESPSHEPLRVDLTPPAPGVVLRLRAGASFASVFRDSDGHPVPDADIEISSTDGLSRTVTTDSAGRFVFRGLPDGEYNLQSSDERLQLDVIVDHGRARLTEHVATEEPP